MHAAMPPSPARDMHAPSFQAVNTSAALQMRAAALHDLLYMLCTIPCQQVRRQSALYKARVPAAYLHKRQAAGCCVGMLSWGWLPKRAPCIPHPLKQPWRVCGRLSLSTLAWRTQDCETQWREPGAHQEH